MRYLVAGAKGFIGSRLCQELKKCGHDVLEFNRDDFRNLELYGKYFFTQEGVGHLDGVFHCAGFAHTKNIENNYELSRAGNVETTKLLLNVAERLDVSGFVYLSSVHALDAEQESVTKNKLAEIKSKFYGKHKLESEKLVTTAGEKLGLHTSIIRPSLVYGNGVKGNLNYLVRAVRARRLPPLPEFGDRRSLVCVDDVVVAAKLAMENQLANGQTYVLTDGIEYTTRQLYEAVMLALGRKLPSWSVPKFAFEFGAIIGDLIEKSTGVSVGFNSSVLNKISVSSVFSSEKIRKELRWRPRYTFFDKLPEMLASVENK